MQKLRPNEVTNVYGACACQCCDPECGESCRIIGPEPSIAQCIYDCGRLNMVMCKCTLSDMDNTSSIKR